MKTLYWIWLHILIALLIQLFCVVIPYNLFFANQEIGTSLLTQQGASIILMSSIISLMFTAYTQPYRWFWCLWFGLFITLPMLLTMSWYFLPWSQISFYLARTIPDDYGAFSILKILSLTAICIGPIFLVGLKIRQLYQAGANGHQHNQPASLYIGRYTRLGSISLIILAGLMLAAISISLLIAMELPNAVTSNSSELDVLATPKHIVPEWHFLAGYSMLRSVPDKILGLIAFGGMVIIPLLLPWLDKVSLKPMWRRPLYAPFFALFLISIAALFYLGMQPFEGDNILWTRTAAIYYFTHLLIVIPVISRLETRKQ